MSVHMQDVPLNSINTCIQVIEKYLVVLVLGWNQFLYSDSLDNGCKLGTVSVCLCTHIYTFTQTHEVISRKNEYVYAYVRTYVHVCSCIHLYINCVHTCTLWIISHRQTLTLAPVF